MLRCSTRLLGVIAISACGFTAGNGATPRSDADVPNIDAAVDAFVVDASICAVASAECVAMDTRVRRCVTAGQPAVDELCPGGCTTTAGPHCRKLTPTGTTVTAADLEIDPQLVEINLSSIVGGQINTDDGSIVVNNQTVRAAGSGIRNGIDFSVRGKVGVFRFHRLVVTATPAVTPPIHVRGANALALVAITDLDLRGEFNLQGDCSGRNAGPGGFPGGATQQSSAGSGGGGSGSGDNDDCTGGGGGGYAGAGGHGDDATNGGQVFGTPTITALVGGGGGGGGGGGNGGDGAGGGGAIQLVANGKIVIGTTSSIVRFGGLHVGGCGGDKGAACGGGGGAGGAILMEAGTIEILNATLAANGGGGGAGDDGSNGANAQLSNTRASGGNAPAAGGGPTGGDGGDGGDDGAAAGANGESADRGGGGGGGVGWIRLNTRTGTITQQGAVFSPAIGSGSSTTLGTAAIQ